MSHKSGEDIICPNCGFHAVENYCARCGQENHLHKETFWGLITHFVSHYFHYDSKFWKTLKALWFSPGKLTKAYWDKQRMRYLPPISLYIFVSAIFFIVLFSRGDEEKTHNTATSSIRNKVDALDDSLSANDRPGDVNYKLELGDNNKLKDYLDHKAEIIEKKHGKDVNKYIKEQFVHNFPKIFFFMIPVMALLLKILFARRKQVFFVHHAIFSLHIHSFIFSIFTLYALMPFIGYWPNVVMMLISAWYFVIAMKRVYEIGYVRSVLNLCVTTIGYFIFLLIAIVLGFLFVLVLA